MEKNITRAGKIVFGRKDFINFRDLYITIRGQVKDKDLQELLLIELQGYLIAHRKEIRNLEQSNTEWLPSSCTKYTAYMNSLHIQLQDSQSKVIFENNFFPVEIYYGMGDLVDYIKNSLPSLYIYKIINRFMLSELSTDIKTLLNRPVVKTNLHFISDTEAVFVYCNIIQPQLIGNSYVRCLRVIQFPAPKSHYIFDTVYYVPVELNSLQILAIELVNKFGELARLSNSIKPTTLVLHFKKIL
jgi:hypothetical protein